MKRTLDKDLNKLVQLEEATHAAARRQTALGLGLVFLVAVWAFSTLQAGGGPGNTIIVLAGIVGGYMALNIGANDVANNVGPAVGSRALTMTSALIIAAVFEAAGAILAGGDVVSTISKEIVDPARIADPSVFVSAMLAALLAAACWINIATYFSAPVSTTHSVVGGVVGAGIAAAGLSAVDWATMATIAASWIISPALGGIIAAAFLAFVKLTVVYRADKVAAAKRWVPVLVALMAGVFSAYLIMKGLKRVWQPGAGVVVAVGFGVFLATLGITRPLIARRAKGMENRNKSVRSLFTLPLICSAALLSFAHGSNDVANAVGPLSAIVATVGTGGVAAEVGIPLWVMLIGAAGIAVGLVLFGPGLIRTVGEKITRMNPMRAYCVALSSAITVIAASALGLPVSSTHIAVGAVFGVGFFREYSTRRRAHIDGANNRGALAAVADIWNRAAGDDEKSRRRKLVRRWHLLTIVAAWLITVPASAILAALLFLALHAFGPA